MMALPSSPWLQVVVLWAMEIIKTHLSPPEQVSGDLLLVSEGYCVLPTHFLVAPPVPVPLHVPSFYTH